MKPGPLPQTLRAAGFSVVSAVFLLVVLAALAVASLNFSSVQHSTTAMDIQGVRAYQAARAGLEWGLHRQLRLGVCDASASFALPAGTTLSTFSVTVGCVKTLTPGFTTSILTAAGNVATATTASAHNLQVGNLVTVANAVPAAYNGDFTVTGVPGATTFTYTMAGAPGGPASTQGVVGLTGLNRWRIVSTACNQPAAGVACPNQNPSPDYVQRVVQGEI